MPYTSQSMTLSRLKHNACARAQATRSDVATFAVHPTPPTTRIHVPRRLSSHMNYMWYGGDKILYLMTTNNLVARKYST
jgi:hypothetical protein